MPGSMRLFQRYRPRDINLEMPVASSERWMTYYQFDEPALNGFSHSISASRDKLEYYSVIATTQLLAQPLNVILEQYLPENQTIDFMSIDVEGLDLEVLKSNDWLKFRPNYLLVEILDLSLESLSTSVILKFLKSKGYKIFAKTLNTSFFVKSEL
jgi:hypothetical protein